MVEYVNVSHEKRLFDRYFSFWIVVFCLPLLFLPKINLLSLAERESAGVRIDDIILMLLSFTMLWGHFALKKQLTSIERWVVALTGFSLFSYGLNQLLITFNVIHVSGSIFYCLRLLEYFMFFYVGALASQFLRLSSIVKVLFVWNLILMLLQRAGLIGQFSISGYLSTASDRVTGIASFPSEAGLLLSMLFCYLIYDDEITHKFLLLLNYLKKFIQKTYVYWLFLVCVTLVIFTGSRIAIFALIIAFLFRVFADLKRASISSWLTATIFTCVAIGVIGTAVVYTDSVFVRSSQLVSVRNLELIGKVWDHIDISQDPIGRENVRNQNYDTSWWIRIHKWCYALKIYWEHPESYLTGIGPGFAMAALDGGFLRILTEYGLIGCVLFWGIFSKIFRMNKQLQWMVIVVCINMIFFDAYLAYKPMSLLFFVTGYAVMGMEEGGGGKGKME